MGIVFIITYFSSDGGVGSVDERCGKWRWFVATFSISRKGRMEGAWRAGRLLLRREGYISYRSGCKSVAAGEDQDACGRNCEAAASTLHYADVCDV